MPVLDSSLLPVGTLSVLGVLASFALFTRPSCSLFDPSRRSLSSSTNRMDRSTVFVLCCPVGDYSRGKRDA